MPLRHFILNPENVKMLKFNWDNTANESILQALKMELHTTSFHCSESLFRIFYAMIYTIIAIL